MEIPEIEGVDDIATDYEDNAFLNHNYMTDSGTEDTTDN